MSSHIEIARQAERDLNTYQAKTSVGKGSSSDDTGVDSSVETKFPGAEVKAGQELSTNAGYNRRIPPSEGGELDDRGRETRGHYFEGEGGPEDKISQKPGGDNDNDVLNVANPQSNEKRAEEPSRQGTNILEQGEDAVKANIGRSAHPPAGQKFKGEDYYVPESVPDSIAAEGNVPPSSVTEASKETEGY